MTVWSACLVLRTRKLTTAATTSTTTETAVELDRQAAEIERQRAAMQQQRSGADSGTSSSSFGRVPVPNTPGSGGNAGVGTGNVWQGDGRSVPKTPEGLDLDTSFAGSPYTGSYLKTQATLFRSGWTAEVMERDEPAAGSSKEQEDGANANESQQ